MAKSLKHILLLCALLIISVKVHGQCTKICGTVTAVNSGTGSIAGTVTVAVKGNYTVATTYSNVSVAGTNTILIGALSVAVANVGTNGALFNGTTLPAGAIINLEIPNAVLPQYTYNCLTSNLIVIVNR